VRAGWVGRGSDGNKVRVNGGAEWAVHILALSLSHALSHSLSQYLNPFLHLFSLSFFIPFLTISFFLSHYHSLSLFPFSPSLSLSPSLIPVLRLPLSHSRIPKHALWILLSHPFSVKCVSACASVCGCVILRFPDLRWLKKNGAKSENSENFWKTPEAILFSTSFTSGKCFCFCFFSKIFSKTGSVQSAKWQRPPSVVPIGFSLRPFSTPPSSEN